MNADIINYSGGGPHASSEELSLIKEALNKGILLVAAAGNESNDTDAPEKQFFPASYNLENIISVASINPYGQLLKSSNFGQKAIEVAAPGLSIKSTTPDGKFGYMTGTSQATAFVTGVSALMLEILKKKQNVFSKIEMMRLTREGILQSVHKSDLLKSKLKTGGIVDATASVQYAMKVSEGSGFSTQNQVVAKTQTNINRREISNKNTNESVKQIQKVLENIATRPNP